jgi:RNA polymerase sigma-70 factor (ECF subfamily)
MDKEVVLQAMRGDGDSFYQLVEEKKQSIYRMAYSYTHNAEDALDIVQEAVYKAYTSITKLKSPEYFGTWFYRIAMNCTLDFVKKNSKVVAISDDILVNMASDEGRDTTEDRVDVQRALAALDEKDRGVVILRFFEELSLDEIAEVLQIPLSTVKSRLYRAMQKLKIEMKEVDGFARSGE